MEVLRAFLRANRAGPTWSTAGNRRDLDHLTRDPYAKRPPSTPEVQPTTNELITINLKRDWCSREGGDQVADVRNP